MNKTTKVFSFAITMFALIGLVTFPSMASAEEPTCDPYDYCPPPPPRKEKEGCTPGFYKANFKKHDGDSWGGIVTTSSLSDVGISAHLHSSDTLLIDALKFHGGPGDEGAERIFLRAAVAAFLNANNPDVNYMIPDGPAAIFAINIAHDFALMGPEGFRTHILGAAQMFDDMNNGPEHIEDFCPLDNGKR